MSDITAGSDAVRQLQANIIGSQYDPANIAAAAEETQLKLQQDRLKPEESRIKLEEDRLRLKQLQEQAPYAFADAQAARELQIQNLAAKVQANKAREVEADQIAQGIEQDKNVKTKFNTWLQSDAGQKANDVDKIEKLASLNFEEGKTEQGAKLLKDAEGIRSKQIVDRTKQRQDSDDAIASANAIIKNLKDDQVNDFINRLPEDQLKAITDRVGKDNWDKLDGKQKKQVLENLFINAKGQLSLEMKQIQAQMKELAEKHADWRAQYRANKQAEKKTSTTDKEDRLSYKTALDKVDSVEKLRNKRQIELDKAVDAAEEKMTESGRTRWYTSKPTDIATTVYNEAVEKRNAYRAETLDKQIRSLESSPDFDGKKDYLSSLKQERNMYPTKDKPESKREAAGKLETPAASAAKSTVPSNKYTIDNPAKPTSKEEYDKLPPGSYYIQDGVTKRKKG